MQKYEFFCITLLLTCKNNCFYVIFNCEGVFVRGVIVDKKSLSKCVGGISKQVDKLTG